MMRQEATALLARRPRSNPPSAPCHERLLGTAAEPRSSVAALKPTGPPLRSPQPRPAYEGWRRSSRAASLCAAAWDAVYRFCAWSVLYSSEARCRRSSSLSAWMYCSCLVWKMPGSMLSRRRTSKWQRWPSLMRQEATALLARRPRSNPPSVSCQEPLLGTAAEPRSSVAALKPTGPPLRSWACRRHGKTKFASYGPRAGGSTLPRRPGTNPMGRGVAQAQQGRASEPAGRAAALCHARVTLDDDNRRWVGLHPDGPLRYIFY